MDDSFRRRPNEISISRVKTIMKSSPDVENVSQESVFLVTKATEMFIKHMVQEAYDVSGKAQTLQYRHVSHLVDSTEELGFLREIVPQKTTLREIEEYQRQKGLKIQRPGTSPSHSEISFSSDDETDLEVLISSDDSVLSSKAKSPVSPKDTFQTSQKFDHEAFVDTSSAVKRSGSSSQTKCGPSSKDRKAEEEFLEMDSDADSSTEVSTGKCLAHEEMLPSPMSVVSISSGSCTPSPSPSYSSLSPDANSVVHVDAESSHSSDCEIIE